jgi:anti-sigma factor RsiW
MDCALTQENLIAYHFGTLEGPARESVEEHLVACTSCLKTYLALKAHLDVAHAGRGGAGPSEAARLRLREAVQRRFRPTPARRVRRWLTHPVPLYQGLAVAAAVALALAVGPRVARQLETGPAPQDSERVDTSRPTAQSLSIF